MSEDTGSYALVHDWDDRRSMYVNTGSLEQFGLGARGGVTHAAYACDYCGLLRSSTIGLRIAHQRMLALRLGEAKTNPPTNDDRSVHPKKSFP